MNYLLVFTLIVIVILLTTNMESFTETFGLSGYTKPVGSVKMNDPRPNLTGFEEFEVSVDNDMMEEFVLQANKEISKRTGICTYIIETTAIKGYRKENTTIYEVMFMTMKKVFPLVSLSSPPSRLRMVRCVSFPFAHSPLVLRLQVTFRRSPKVLLERSLFSMSLSRRLLSQPKVSLIPQKISWSNCNVKHQ
jgi:hypothetical protein